MRLKVVGDGRGATTKIVNADTGEVLEGVQSISYRLPSFKDRAILVIEVAGVSAEIEATTGAIHWKRPSARHIHWDGPMVRVLDDEEGV